MKGTTSEMPFDVTQSPIKMIEFIDKHGRSPLTLAGLVGVLVTIYLVSNKSASLTVTLIVAALLIVVIWAWTRRVPRLPKDKIGFLIAIRHEDEAQGRQISSDYITALRNALITTQGSERYAFLELSQFHVNQIFQSSTSDPQTKANYCLKKSRAAIIQYGRAKIRRIEGVNHHVLETSLIVSHTTIPKHISEQFGVEIGNAAFPRIMFPKDNDLIAFEISAAWHAISAKYVIARAAMISLDVDLAESLLTELRYVLAAAQEYPPQIGKIISWIPLNLSQIHLYRFQIHFDKWKVSRLASDLASARHFLDRVKDAPALQYRTNIFRAICKYVLDGDISGALDDCKKCKDICNGDVTWRLSSAFLCALSGDIYQAITHYTRAGEGHVPLHVPGEAEEFLEWQLQKSLNEPAIHLCLGLLNHFVKNDAKRALDELTVFEKTFDAKTKKGRDGLNRVRPILSQLRQLERDGKIPASDP